MSSIYFIHSNIFDTLLYAFYKYSSSKDSIMEVKSIYQFNPH